MRPKRKRQCGAAGERFARRADTLARRLGVWVAAEVLGVSRNQVWRLRRRLTGGPIPRLAAHVYFKRTPKLSLEIARDIRAAEGVEKRIVLAARHGVGEAIIRRVWRGDLYPEPHQ